MITSVANEKVKFVKKLSEKKFRDEEGLFVAEGANILSDLKEGFSVRYLFATEDNLVLAEKLSEKFGVEPETVDSKVMKAMSDTVTPCGILAVIEKPRCVPSGTNAIVLDGVSDSGNLGTIIRTAAGAGFSDVYLIGCADPFSPKTVRASMGAVLRVNIIVTDKENLQGYLDGYVRVAMDMSGDDVFGFKPRRKVALFFGNEAHGLSDFSFENSDVILSIPMQNGQESLNVAVAAGIAMYVINHNFINK